MLFNSPVYIFLFLPVVVIIYFSLNHRRLFVAGKAWLVLASLFFYGYWNETYLLLIISSILVNFSIGTSLHKGKASLGRDNHKTPIARTILTTGILINIGLLAYFKYYDFFIYNINDVFGLHFPILEIALPLAISFFTFQQIAYLVDCYQTDTLEYDFLSYCLFVTFFPQLIAGPIVHHQEMMPQFVRIRNALLNWGNIAMGLFVFSIGLFKKVYIADSFALWANTGFNAGNELGFLASWGTSLSYTFQLYFDFSAYTDMAIGAALLFNIRLPINFNSPYKAVSIQDFWRRWHITLSRWLRDYLYIPLGGNRKGSSRMYANLFLTFILGGLWHGAGWTFIIWGALHGTALCIHRGWQRFGLHLPTAFAWLVTFLFINVAWVFFRADSFSAALLLLKGMTSWDGAAIQQATLHFFNHISDLSWINNGPLMRPDSALSGDTVLYILVFGAISFLLPNTMQMIGFVEYGGRWKFRSNLFIAIGTGILASIAVWLMVLTEGTEFLYFNF